MKKGNFELLIIGGSAGSLSVVLQIIPLLRLSMNLSVLVVFHRKQSEDTTLVDVLSSRTEYEVKEIEDKDEVMPGVIYLAPADYHVLIEKDKSLSLDGSERVNYSRPSIDVSFESGAEVYGPSLACLLLSGANADGVAGLLNARKMGSYIIVQDPDSAEVPYMPQQAVDKVAIDLLISSKNFNELTALFSTTD